MSMKHSFSICLMFYWIACCDTEEGCLKWGQWCFLPSTKCNCCTYGSFSGRTVDPKNYCTCGAYPPTCDAGWPLGGCCSNKCGTTVKGTCDAGAIGDVCDKNLATSCQNGSECVESTNPDVNTANREKNWHYGECRVITTSSTSTTSTTTTTSTSTVTTTEDTHAIDNSISFALEIYLSNRRMGYSIMERNSPMPGSVADLDKLIKDTHYSAALFPGYTGGKLDVGVSTYVENLRPINDLHMEWEVFLMLTWMDARLNNTKGTEYGYVQLNSASDRKKVWTPAIFFPQSTAKIPKVLNVNQIIYVHYDGIVVSSSRVILTAPCKTDLRKHPRNDLDCSVYFSNMAQVGEHLDLIWLEPLMVKPLSAALLPPVTLNKKINPTLVIIGTDVTLKKNVTFGIDFGGDCSSARPCLSATVHCTKGFGNFMVDTVSPSLVTIILSWVSLFIRKDVISTRVGIAIRTMYSLQGIVAGFNVNSLDSTIVSSAQIWLFGQQFHIVALLVFLVVSIGMNEINLKQTRLKYKSAEIDDSDPQVELSESSDPIDIYFGIAFVVVNIFWSFYWFLL